MATEKSAAVFDSPDGIALYRLAAMKARIGLEAKGMKARGGSTRAAIAAELGLKPRSGFDKFEAELQKRINELKTKIYRDRMVVEERGTDHMVMSCDRSALVMMNQEVTTHNQFKVFFYEAGKAGDAKPMVVLDDEAQALDTAEAWVTEIR